MKNNSSVTKRILKWSAMSLIGLVVILIGAAYLSVELFLQSSYRNMASGSYSEALQDSAWAINIADLLYPASSKHLQDIFLYDARISSRLGILGNGYGDGLANRLIAKTVMFEKINKHGLSLEEAAKIDIDVARLENSTYHGQGVKAMVRDIINKTLPVNSELMVYAQEESAYQDVVGVFAMLKEKSVRDKILNDSIVDSANKAHDVAQKTICEADVEQCRFNQLRWQIGLCIRRAYLNEAPACTAEVLREVTIFPSACGKDMTTDQCYKVMNDLLPYYHHLLQAQGNGVLAK